MALTPFHLPPPQDFNELVELASKGNMLNVDNDMYGLFPPPTGEDKYAHLRALPNIPVYRFGKVVDGDRDLGELYLEGYI